MPAETTIRYRGKRLPVRGEVTIRGRRFPITARLGSADRRRLQVYDRAARTLRVVLEAPDSEARRQQAAVLRRHGVGWNAFPQVLDCVHQGQVWTLLTTWVEGQSLESYLRAAREGRRPWPSVYESVRLFRSFVHGLCHFHTTAACVHGDIAPGNLIVSQRPHTLVLIDFGSAWPMESSATRARGDGATPGYAAPETQLGEQADPLSDQFAATSVFYEMLTGQLPYDQMGGRAGLPRHREDFASAYQPPSDLVSSGGGVPRTAWEPIDRLCHTGLRLDPQGRFSGSRVWRDNADAAWDAVRISSNRSAFERIGASLARWIEERIGSPRRP